MLEPRPSSIQGTGCFATRAIPAYSTVGRFIGTVWRAEQPENDTHVLWLDDETALEVENELRYVNHADEPNCEVVVLDGAEVALLIARRDIAASEELTMHYGEDWR